MAPETLALITEGRAKKGDVLGVARLAGIMGAKKTADLIPLCHPLPVTKVALDLPPTGPARPAHHRHGQDHRPDRGRDGGADRRLDRRADVYDMVKAAEKGMEIGGIRLVLKEGGKSGRYEAPE
jgi:cyclic pyranopterin phosphate synthase